MVRDVYFSLCDGGGVFFGLVEIEVRWEGVGCCAR